MKVLSGDYRIDGLLEQTTMPNPVLTWQSTNTLGTPISLNYGFLTGATNGVSGFAAMNSTLQADTATALQNFSNVANITFTQQATPTNVLDFGTADYGYNPAGYTAGIAYQSFFNTGVYSYFASVDVYITNNVNVGYSSAPVGSQAYETLLHEIGHGLGLKHSFENPSLPAAEDTTQYTVMSYTNAYGSQYAATLMLYDIMALQYMYGANTSYNSGNTVYDLQAFLANGPATMWDGGGSDTISLSSYATGQTLNLTEGEYSSIGGTANNFVIAYNANIENASGTAANDQITGSSVGNSISGAGGRDRLLGEDGGDSLYGGNDNDTLLGGEGGDTLFGQDDVDRIFGHNGTDSLYGGNQDDFIFGGGDADLIVGGEGGDFANGNTDSDVVQGGGGNDTLFGGGGDDTVEGDIGADQLYGQSDSDIIYGGAENDLVNGGGGDDSLYGGTGRDTLIGSAGNDLLVSADEADSLNGGSGNDTLFGGSGADVMNGFIGDDSVYGGDGSDDIRGGSGNDLLNGGGQDDRFIFDNNWGDDTILGFANNGVEKVDLRNVTGIDDINDLTITTENGDAKISYSGNSITFDGLTVGQIDSSDFLF